LTGSESSAVERTIRIGARPATVWRYWTDPARICEWWGASAELDPRPGGICLVRLGGDAVMRGEFVELIPTGASSSRSAGSQPTALRR
jgi:uncharacterized protein YndB with AHSA1/START domain